MSSIFASRRWVVIHIATAVIVVTCLSLAAWQFDRLQDRKADNARLSEQMQLPATNADAAFEGASPTDDALYRRVTASGRYDPGEEVLLRSRSFEGRPGHHLLTPLVTDSGTALIVDRGWVPLEIEQPSLPEAAPPTGTVEVTGVLLASETKGFLGLADPPAGHTDSLPRADLDRLADQLPYPIHPLYLRLQNQLPAGSQALPEPVPIPEPDEGPHLSYAVQWLFFGFAATVVYAGLIRKERQRAAAEHDQPAGSG